jgi:heme/copper-type cytochrome/quinol oxidase subunit 1
MAASTSTSTASPPQLVAGTVAREESGWFSRLTTVDHKRLGIMYMVLAFVFFVLGGTEALMMRLQLGVPSNDLVTPQLYNQLFTLHGSTMIFLFVVPFLAGLGTWLLPLMLGARSLAFPRLAALSFWLLLFGGIVFYASLFWTPPETGWTASLPLSNSFYSPGGGTEAWILLILLTGLSSLLTAVNFLSTLISLRAPGMSWSRIPLFAWSLLAWSVAVVVAVPVLLAAVVMLLSDRRFGTHFFDASGGGSPLLWEDLFWFALHPGLSVMLLPAFGIVSEILPVFARKPIFGYRAIAFSIVAIALLSFLGFFGHLYTGPVPEGILIVTMLASLAVLVPIAVAVFNWIATLWRGAVELRTPLLFCVGFITLFLIGTLSGLFLAVFPVDWQLGETYFAVAGLHFVLLGGAVFAIFAAIYFWFPKITGRLLDEKLGRLSFALMFVGVLLTFLVQHSIGLEGMPRRVYEYEDVGHLALYNMISSIGSFVIAAGVLVTVVNVVRSLRGGAVAGPDPWKASTLEWFAPSPPPAANFDVVPRVRSAEPLADIRAEIALRSGETPSGGPLAGGDGASIHVPAGATRLGV